MTYALGERFPSGVNFFFATPSLTTIGALGELVRCATEDPFRSDCDVVCVVGARVGYVDPGLESGSDGGGAKGAATAVDMSSDSQRVRGLG